MYTLPQNRIPALHYLPRTYEHEVSLMHVSFHPDLLTLSLVVWYIGFMYCARLACDSAEIPLLVAR